MDLQSLLSALQTTQQAKSAVRLSERNVIELVNKLKQLGIIGDDLLHTINGKEYITQDRLKQEIKQALKQAGGRLALVELPALIGVDLVHCERQGAALVAESDGAVMEAQGELITTQYFDSIAAEINDLLQESGQVSVADLAVQYALNTELIMSTISQRVGSLIMGRLEGGLLYTPAYLRNIKAQMRGALRGVVEPTTMPAVVKDLGIEGVGFGGAGNVLTQLVEELVSEGAVKGNLKGGGVHWVPAAYASAQQGAVSAFYSQNGWVGYDLVKRMGIANEKNYLKGAFPEGIALETAFVGPLLLSQLEAAVEDALSGGTWVDVAPLLPSVLTAADASALLSRVPQLQQAGAGGAGSAGAATGGKGSKGAAAAAAAAGGVAAGGQGAGAAARAPVVLAHTCVVSGKLVSDLQAEVDADARQAAEKALQERRAGPGQAQPAAAPQQAAGKKAAAAAADDDDDDWGTGKKGKGGKGGKGGKAAGKGASGARAGGKAAEAAGSNSSSAVGVSVSTVAAQILALHEGMDGAGEDGGLPDALAEVLLPGAVAAWEAALAAAFTAGAEERRRAKDSLAKAFEEAFTRLSLYTRGVEEFAPAEPAAAAAAPAAGSGKGGKGSKEKQAQQEAAGSAGEDTYQVLSKHVARSTGAECADLLFKWVRVEQAAADEAPPTPAQLAELLKGPPLPAAQRSALLRNCASDVAEALSRAADAPNAAALKEVETALESAAGDLGLRVRQLDKKSEKAAAATERARLLDALSAESDAAAALMLVVPLLFLKATGKAISLPGKAVSAVLARASKDLPAETVAAVETFHSQVVDYLKASSAVGGKPAAEVGEQLAQALPNIKSLVGLGGPAGAET